jgi:hypothetical protein
LALHDNINHLGKPHVSTGCQSTIVATTRRKRPTGFGVGNTVSDEIPPYVGRSSSVGELLQMLALVAFLATVVGAICSLILMFRSAGVARRAWQASR